MQIFNFQDRKLPRHVSLARHNILNQYKKLGESEDAIDKIQYEVKNLVEGRYDLASILPGYCEYLEQVEVAREHKIIRLTQHNNFKVAIHIIPSMYQIPAHLHPNLISVVNVQYGELRIKQFSLSTDDEVFYRDVKAHQSCAGLIKLRNIHSIQSLASPCVFLSFRISKQFSYTVRLKKHLSTLASSMLFIFSSFFGPNLIAGEKSPASLVGYYQNEKNKKVILANNLRTGNGIKQDLYGAATIYKEEAVRGNAEAQYWIGVMYFDGSGITEDTDEALHWVALSSDQNYPPAQKLLHYMLTTDEVLDC